MNWERCEMSKCERLTRKTRKNDVPPLCKRARRAWPLPPGPQLILLVRSCVRLTRPQASGLKIRRHPHSSAARKRHRPTRPSSLSLTVTEVAVAVPIMRPRHRPIWSSSLVTKYADWLHFRRLLTKISVDPTFFSSLVNHIVDPDTQIVGNYARMLVRPPGSDPTAPGGCAY